MRPARKYLQRTASWPQKAAHSLISRKSASFWCGLGGELLKAHFRRFDQQPSLRQLNVDEVREGIAEGFSHLGHTAGTTAQHSTLSMVFKIPKARLRSKLYTSFVLYKSKSELYNVISMNMML